MNKILTQNYEEFLNAKNVAHKTYKTEDFWESRNNWKLKNVQPQRFENQVKFIDEKFIPLLNKTNEVCDFACACGDFTFQIAYHVKHVDGYDISPLMVEKAKEAAKENKVTNVSFHQGNALNVKFNKTYDAFMTLGLFTYFFGDDDFLKVIKKVKNAMKLGAVLVVKDSLTLKENDYYYYAPHSGNTAIYRSKTRYLGMFESLGFSLKEETLLSENEHLTSEEEAANLISLGSIFLRNA